MKLRGGLAIFLSTPERNQTKVGLKRDLVGDEYKISIGKKSDQGGIETVTEAADALTAHRQKEIRPRWD